jgi:hypothetical protein
MIISVNTWKPDDRAEGMAQVVASTRFWVPTPVLQNKQTNKQTNQKNPKTKTTKPDDNILLQNKVERIILTESVAQWVLFIWHKVSLHSLGCPRMHYCGPHRPQTVYQVLEWQACATVLGSQCCKLIIPNLAYKFNIISINTWS